MVRFCPPSVPTKKSCRFGICNGKKTVLSPFRKHYPTTGIMIEIRLDPRILTAATHRFGEAESTLIAKMGDNNAEPSGNEVEKEPPFPLTEIDKWVLSQTDEEFHLHDWDELREIIGGCNVDFAQRSV
jgi:hypothetical protein